MNLDGTKRQLRDVAKRKVERAAARMTDDLKRTAPVNTGELRRQTGVEYQGQTDKVTTALAQVNVEYGAFVVQGTRPHIIRGNPTLRFYWPKAGAVVYFASVNHPGTTANPFYDNVIRRWSDYLR